MSRKTITDLANSKFAIESIKRLRPSSFFLFLLIISVPIILRYLFADVSGFDYMVWIWFIVTMVSVAVAIFSYSIDMAAYSKRNNYEKSQS